MEKTIVLYKSKYGSAKRYAEWIAEALGCDVKDSRKVRPDDLAAYNTVIFGGGIYAGSLSGAKFIKKHFGQWKNTIVFMVGAAPADAVGLIEKTIQDNFDIDTLKKIKVFYMQGDMDYNKMTPMHKMMINMLRSMLAKKDIEELTDIEKGMLENIRKPANNTGKENIARIVEYVKSIEKT